MNNTKIEWCDRTWNPIVGCKNICPFCYARRQAKRQKHRCTNCYNFIPHLHPERLQDKELRRKKPLRIFADSMSDFFGPGVKLEWQQQIMECITLYSQHTFILLTKYPQRIKLYPEEFPSNVWVLVSICNENDSHRISTLLQSKIISVYGCSLEPFHDYVNPEKFEGLDWVIIGMETGPKPQRPHFNLTMKQIKDLTYLDIPIFVKDNCGFPMDHPFLLREFPREFNELNRKSIECFNLGWCPNNQKDLLKILNEEV